MDFHSMRVHIKRFFKRWFTFAGLYFMAGSCPCCGGPGCPAGAGIVGFILAIGSLLKHPFQKTGLILKSLLVKTNSKTLKAEHSRVTKLHTWGELADLQEIDPGSAPKDAPIRRLIGSPTLLRKRDNVADGEDEGSQPKSSGLHPIWCLCGWVPSNPGSQEFQQKLLSMINKKGENHD